MLQGTRGWFLLPLTSLDTTQYHLLERREPGKGLQSRPAAHASRQGTSDKASEEITATAPFVSWASRDQILSQGDGEQEGTVERESSSRE